MKLGSIVTVRGESQHSVIVETAGPKAYKVQRQDGSKAVFPVSMLIDTGKVAVGYKYRTEGHKYFNVSPENDVLGFRPQW